MRAWCAQHAGRLLGLRRYGMVSKGGAEIDLRYLIALVDRPAAPAVPPRPLMTPERWPDIRVKSAVCRISSSEQALHDESGFAAATHADTRASAEAEAASEPTDPAVFWRAPEARPKDGDGCSFDEVIEKDLAGHPQTQNTESALRKLEDMLKSISVEQRTADDGASSIPSAEEKVFAYWTEVVFGEDHNKTLTSVLAKAFDYQDSPPAGDPRGARPGDDPAPVAVHAGEDSDAKPKASKPPNMRVLVMAGEDLHLLDYHHLQCLATVYGLSPNKSRYLMERQLCRLFGQSARAGPVEDLSCAAVGSDREFRAFTKTTSASPPKGNAGPVTWTESDDRRLCETIDRLRAQRLAVVGRVEAWLDEHGVPATQKTQSGAEENTNVWEMAAVAFPGRSPKACRKRWLLCQRMHSMQSRL